MDLRPTPEQQQLVDTLAALYAKESPPERVRAAEPLGFDKALWERLIELGVLAMAAPEHAGGWGASLLDLALAAEQQGRWLASAPIIESQAAVRLLASLGTTAAADALAPVLAGDHRVVLAVRPAVAGVAALVPGAAVADRALVVVDDRVELVPIGDNQRPVDNLGSMPLADVTVSGSRVVARGEGALLAFEAAVDDWLALSAAALVGIGARALELGVEYAKERKAWGVPIGTFQAVAHPLADCAAAVDGARLLAYEAAWAAAEEPVRSSELAAMAIVFAYQAARDTTARSLHFHGGYGFMMEYDVQLYWRRARAWANVFAEPRAVYGRVADRRYGAVGV